MELDLADQHILVEAPSSQALLTALLGILTNLATSILPPWMVILMMLPMVAVVRSDDVIIVSLLLMMLKLIENLKPYL